MNTKTAPFRLTAAASAVALAVTLAGWVAAPAAAAGESRPRVASEVVVTSAMHRALLRQEADRYVHGQLIRARIAAEEAAAAAASIDVVLTHVSGR